MSVSRVSVQLQAVYGELLGRLQAAQVDGMAEHEGAFATKKVSGRTYWYFRRRVAGKVVERYVGPDSPDLRDRIAGARELARDAQAAARGRRELVRLLRSAGLPVPDARTGRLLQALAVAGAFRLRAVLVGTHAFRCYGPMLGVRLPAEAALTSDVDLAQFQTVSVALGDALDDDLETVLARVDRFTPVPGLHAPTVSTAWKSADRALELELLTPMVGPPDEEPRRLPALRAHATPLRFLDYLIFRTEAAAVPHGAGVLVNVPAPERFACHKLLVSQRRHGPHRAKAAKDIAQAAALVEVLAEDRPGDLADAWADLVGRGGHWRDAAERGAARLPGDLARALG
ncbi:MAG: hypothetical protein H6907_00905 [Hyphomicrobiales bacterium]|nr:hypothetical protein [Hyphomicrobiales bacterium]MCP5370264.1 hypothetical protein [Hyphomicrobiales bacterium]